MPRHRSTPIGQAPHQSPPRITGDRARDVWRHAFSAWRVTQGGRDAAANVMASRLLRLIGCQWGLPRRDYSPPRVRHILSSGRHVWIGQPIVWRSMTEFCQRTRRTA